MKKVWYKSNWIIIPSLILFFPLGLFLVIKSNWSKNTKVIASFVTILLVCLITVYGVINAPPSVEVAYLKPDATLLTDDKQFVAKGHVYPYGSKLYINDEEIPTQAQGVFSKTIELNPGINTINFRVVDGDKVTVEIYTIKTPTQEEIDAKNAASQPNENVTTKEPELDPRYYWHKVVRVIDGDTLVANVDGKDEKIRVIGIDAPESTTSQECFGKESSNKAKEFLNGKWIQLERDDSQSDRDKYNRLLRYVWFDSGTDFGRRLIEEGYAFEYTYNTPYAKQLQYKSTQTYAKDNLKGLWSSRTCSGKTSKKSSINQKPKSQPKVSTPSTSIKPNTTSNCDPNYSGGCVPNVSYDLDCSDISFSVRVIGVDTHRFDRDGDGYGCESN